MIGDENHVASSVERKIFDLMSQMKSEYDTMITCEREEREQVLQIVMESENYLDEQDRNPLRRRGNSTDVAIGSLSAEDVEEDTIASSVRTYIEQYEQTLTPIELNMFSMMTKIRLELEVQLAVERTKKRKALQLLKSVSSSSSGKVTNVADATFLEVSPVGQLSAKLSHHRSVNDMSMMHEYEPREDSPGNRFFLELNSFLEKAGGRILVHESEEAKGA